MQQFSLKRLLLGITVISMVLGFAQAFPIVTGRATANLLVIAPAAIVFGIAYAVSKRRIRTTEFVLSGVLIGWMLTPRIYVYWGPEATFWEEFLVDFSTQGMGMFGGAVIAAVVDFAIQWRQRRVTRKRPHDPAAGHDSSAD